MLRAVAFAIAVIVIAAPAKADDSVIGFVKTLSGNATITRNGTTEAIRPGTALHEKDQVATAADGSVGITLRDNTRIALGPGSRIELALFEFKPAEKRFGFLVRLLRGTIDYFSGGIARLAPDTVTIELPTATIGVRGTAFCARAED
jgi:hypothetical protein